MAFVVEQEGSPSRPQGEHASAEMRSNVPLLAIRVGRRKSGACLRSAGSSGLMRNDPALIPLGVQDGKRGRNAAPA